MTDKFAMERRAPEWFFKTTAEMPRWKQIIWRLLGERREGGGETEYGKVKVVGYTFKGITLITKTTFIDWEG